MQPMFLIIGIIEALLGFFILKKKLIDNGKPENASRF